MSNMEFWDKVKRPPTSALKQIKGGRLQGMTDINPQWRIEAMTEHFGQCGVGWYYEVQKFWTEAGYSGELMAFVHIHLFTRSTIAIETKTSILPPTWSMPSYRLRH